MPARVHRDAHVVNMAKDLLHGHSLYLKDKHNIDIIYNYLISSLDSDVDFSLIDHRLHKRKRPYVLVQRKRKLKPSTDIITPIPVPRPVAMIHTAPPFKKKY
jgi:hypothetical protein